MVSSFLYVNLYVNTNETTMKVTTNFYIEKRAANKGNDTPILMFVYFDGKRMQYYTGERCAPGQWIDKDKEGNNIQQVRKNAITPKFETGASINRRLSELEDEVNQYFVVCEKQDEKPTHAGLRTFLDLFLGKVIIEPEIKPEPTLFDRYEQYRDEKNISEGRKRHLKVSKGKLQRFAPGITFDEITPQFLTDYQNHLIRSGLSRNTTTSELKYLRAFLKHAKKMGWTQNYPFDNFSIEQEAYGEPVYITLQERDELFNANIRNAHLARVRDIFVFQCMVGCRVGDLLRLKKSNIIDGCIEYIAGKTKDEKPKIARIPLSEKAKTILSRYDLPGDELLPFISEQKYNDYIKDLFRATGLNRVVTIRDPQTGLARQVPISEVASSHMARRVFVGGLFGKGVKNEIIASMSGHVQNSKSFMRYYTIEKQNQIDAIKAIE